ncbi:MAG: acetyl-CoA carboxylase biotin carboxyl carrier protein [Acidobacteriaceae bacterium]|nr:acetyl-CoA carboxylase biotin carboxyl carrier protein [Acidobacteriaceae bacterium]MBV9767720.1 acetyl-CoA carboxylase biotin carboxyl carrier protein [Acidobacteriaceae bacterium]
MTIDEIKELIHLVRDTGVTELEVQRGENRVRIRSAPDHKEIMVPTVVPVPLTASGGITSAAVPAPAREAAPAPSAPLPREDERDVIVKSPIVGTYYDAPAPGAAPFVKTNDRVEPKQVLCIIESMKLMNEIEAELAGTLIAKHVENGRPVEYGESLFTIRPL